MTKIASGKAKFFLIACATVKPNGFLKPSFVLFTLSPSRYFFSGGCTFLNTAADLILFACAEIQLDASFRNRHYRKVAVRALEFNKISAREVESVTVGVGGEFFERRLVGDGL